MTKGIRSVDRHALVEFLEPIQNDVDLGAGGLTAFGLIGRKHHHESLAVRRDVVVPVKTHHDEPFDGKRLLIAERKVRFRDDID